MIHTAGIYDLAAPVLFALAALTFAADTAGLLFMLPAVFRLGPQVAVISRSDGPVGPLTPGKGQTPRLRYRVLDSGEVVFRRKWLYFERRSSSWLDPKGLLERDGGSWVATARLPLGVLALYVWFGLTLVAESVSALLSAHPSEAATRLLVLAFLGWLTWWITAAEIDRFPDLVEELVLGLEVYAEPWSGAQPVHRADAAS